MTQNNLYQEFKAKGFLTTKGIKLSTVRTKSTVQIMKDKQKSNLKRNNNTGQTNNQIILNLFKLISVRKNLQTNKLLFIATMNLSTMDLKYSNIFSHPNKSRMTKSIFLI